MINDKCEDHFCANIAPRVEQEVGYRSGNLGIPTLDLLLALPVELSADGAVQKESGSLSA
jgi:hypothetical protein